MSSRSPRSGSRERSPVRRSTRSPSPRRSASKSPRRGASPKRSPSPRTRSPVRDSRRDSRDRKDSRSRSHSRDRKPYRGSRSPSPRRDRGGRAGGRGGDEPAPPSKVVGIFGLSSSTRESDLREEFEKYGDLENVVIIYDKNTGESKRFGFVYFVNEEDAIKAKEASTGMILHGNEVRIDFSKTRRAYSPTPGRYMGKRQNDRRNTRYAPYSRGGYDRDRGYNRGGYDRGYDRGYGARGYDRYDGGDRGYDRYSGGGSSRGYDRDRRSYDRRSYDSRSRSRSPRR